MSYRRDDTLFGFTAVTGVIAALCGFALLVWGGYELGWWLEEDRVNRTAEISDDSVNRESALREEALDHQDSVLRLRANAPDDDATQARITAALSRFCDTYEQIDNLQMPDHAVEFAEEEC